MTTSPPICPRCKTEMLVVYGVKGDIYAGFSECMWIGDPFFPISEVISNRSSVTLNVKKRFDAKTKALPPGLASLAQTVVTEKVRRSRCGAQAGLAE